MQRIAKIIAASGLCSRREAERWILDGRVAVDGITLDSPALTVSEDQNVVVDGKPLPQVQTPRLWSFHKPKGCITSRKDELDRQTVFDLLPEKMQQLHTIGRLDYNSEGLLLLTNSPSLKRHMELPKTAFKRVYRVRAYGTPSKRTIKELAEGITVEAMEYKPILVSIESAKGHNSWLIVTLTEGKNREIRRAFEHYDHQVSRLIRLSYGDFMLEDLPLGKTAEIPSTEWSKDLLKQFRP